MRWADRAAAVGAIAGASPTSSNDSISSSSSGPCAPSDSPCESGTKDSKSTFGPPSSCCNAVFAAPLARGGVPSGDAGSGGGVSFRMRCFAGSASLELDLRLRRSDVDVEGAGERRTSSSSESDNTRIEPSCEKDRSSARVAAERAPKLTLGFCEGAADSDRFTASVTELERRVIAVTASWTLPLPLTPAFAAILLARLRSFWARFHSARPVLSHSSMTSAVMLPLGSCVVVAAAWSADALFGAGSLRCEWD